MAFSSFTHFAVLMAVVCTLGLVSSRPSFSHYDIDDYNEVDAVEIRDIPLQPVLGGSGDDDEYEFDDEDEEEVRKRRDLSDEMDEENEIGEKHEEEGDKNGDYEDYKPGKGEEEEIDEEEKLLEKEEKVDEEEKIEEEEEEEEKLVEDEKKFEEERKEEEEEMEEEGKMEEDKVIEERILKEIEEEEVDKVVADMEKDSDEEEDYPEDPHKFFPELVGEGGEMGGGPAIEPDFDKTTNGSSYHKSENPGFFYKLFTKIKEFPKKIHYFFHGH